MEMCNFDRKHADALAIGVIIHLKGVLSVLLRPSYTTL